MHVLLANLNMNRNWQNLRFTILLPKIINDKVVAIAESCLIALSMVYMHARTRKTGIWSS